MSDISHLLAVLAVVCALTSLGFGIAIANDLRTRGLRANPLLVKWMVFRYMATYKRVTLEETGQVGPLYHGCSIAATAALVLVVTVIIMQTL